MFNELMNTIKPGNVLRVNKGILCITLPIESIVVHQYDGVFEISIKLMGDNDVALYDEDYCITKVTRPPNLMDKFEFCYRIIDEEDCIFYITDK